MKRRGFIAFAGGASMWPLIGRAQQLSLPVVGILGGSSAAGSAAVMASLQRGLSETGFVEGRTVGFEYRWSDGNYDRLPELAAELVSKRVNVIVALLGAPTALAAKAATRTIPIVFQVGADPVSAGLVTSLARPEGNLTGVTSLTIGLAAKRLEIFKRLIPELRSLGFIVNPTNLTAEPLRNEIETAAKAFGIQAMPLLISDDKDIDAAFALANRDGLQALAASGDPFTQSRAGKIIELAARHRIPAMYFDRSFTEAGGLISYGANLSASYQNVGAYVGRILKGDSPRNLPVLQPTRFELIINLRTAKQLGLEVSPFLIALTDEVIE